MRVQCKGKLHLGTYLQSAIDTGGEGVVLQKKGSLYEPGRVDSLIKLKVVPTLSCCNCLLLLGHKRRSRGPSSRSRRN